MQSKQVTVLLFNSMIVLQSCFFMASEKKDSAHQAPLYAISQFTQKEKAEIAEAILGFKRNNPEVTALRISRQPVAPHTATDGDDGQEVSRLFVRGLAGNWANQARRDGDVFLIKDLE